MKKILSVVAMLLMLCMLVTLAPITALAADTPTIVISDAKNTAGSEVEVTVALVNNPGVNRMMLFLQYDTSKLTYVGVEDSEDGFIGNTHNPATGLLKWNQGIDNLEGDVTLATVTFKIAEGLADGETATISVTYDNSDAQIINNNGETVDFAVIPGTVTVGEPDPNPIEDFVYLIDGENLIIGDYVGSTKTVIIAETYEIDGEVYTVTEINGFSKKSGKTTYTYVPFYANGTKGDTDDTFVEVVYIPATVTKIGSLDDEYYPFYGCMDLKHAYIYGDPEIADGTLGVYYDEAEEADIAVPTTTIHAYADTGVEAYAESWGIAFEAIVDAPAGCEHVAGEAVRENETDSTCTVAGTYDEVVYCSVCGEELSRTEKTKELAAHTEAAAVVENETNSTCTVAGTYDEVVYCSVCGEELSRTEKTKELAAHTEAAAVVENETDSTCTVAGTYDEVVYCSVCGEELSRTEKTKALADHTEADAVRENETDSTCTVAGTYEEVVYCSVCGEELSRTEKTKELAAHTAGDAVVENATEASCGEAGSYDEVIYCSVCNKELSRTHKTVDALPHTPGAAVRENETASTCTVAGTYEEVVYCSACGEELSRTEKTKELAAHTEAAAVVENETDSTCTVAGTYDEVVYCSVCGEELSRTEKTKELAAHTEAAAVVENETDSTCTVAGTYDEVVYCSVCGEELSRTEKTKELAAHTEAAAVVENETNSTCTVAGTYEEVVYCSVCGEELSRTEKTKELADHTEADAVRENETDSTCTVAGTYDEVVYCSVCGEELSRTEKTKALADHTEADAVRENETDSTCTVAGTYDEVIYCSVCDKELSRTEKTKELADHSWTAADCETARTCSVCGETDGVALGHDFSVEIESVDPTVDAEGYTVYQCSRCDETKTVTVEKLTKPTLTLDGTTVTVNDPSNVLVQTGVKYVGANSGIDATAIVDWADFTGLTGTALNGKNGYTNNGKATAIQVAENGDYIFYVIYKNGDTSAFYAEKITVVAAAGVPTVTVTGNTATLDINGNTLVQLGAKYVGNATINAADIKTMSAFTKLTGTALDGKSGYSNLGKNTVANLADGGNYIFYVIYKDALGNTKTIFINVTVNVANDKPTIEVVDGVATLKDNGFTLVQSGVKYVGDADVNAADIKGWGTFTKLAGTALNGKSGYTNLGKATEANLTEAGNYVYYVIYKDANNVTRTIFYNVTVE